MTLYDGFISYSHAADGKLAPSIQAALHALARPWYKLRALNVFRDKTSLAADPGLWPSIERALSIAKWFIYLASPKAAQSEWVRREIDWWLTNQDSSSILIVVTEGMIAWDHTTNDFNWNATDAVPVALSGRFSAEPLWVDLRWARSQDNLSLRHSGFRDAILDIATPLHGRPKDELDGADVRQYRRNRRTAAAAIVSLVLLTVSASIAAFLAIHQSRLSSSRELAAHAVGQLDRDPELGIRLALHALDKAETLQAENALRRALAESRHLYTIRAPTEVSLARYSGDGSVLALASGRQIALVDAARGEVRHILSGHSSPVSCLSVSENSQLVASGDMEGVLRIWKIAGGEFFRSFRAAKGAVRRVEFNPTGELLLTTHELTTERERDPAGKVDLGDAALARIWKLANGELVEQFNHGGIVTDAEFDPSGRYVVTAGYDATAKVWDIRRGGLRRAFTGHARRLLAVRFSHDGRSVVTVDEELAVRRWNTDTGELEASGGQKVPVTNFTDATNRHAQISPSGSRTVLIARKSIKAYETTTGQEIADLRGVPTSIHGVVFSRDEQLLAFGGEESSTLVWDLKASRQIAKLRGQQGGISDMVFSPDGNALVTGGVDGTARAWDIRSRGPTQLIIPHGEAVTAAVWDKAGRLIASGGEDGKVMVHDKYGNHIATFVAKGRISALSFSEDGKRLIAARYDNGGAHIWDVNSGMPIIALKGTEERHEVLRGADYSPDERIVIAQSKGRVLRWDAESGKRLSDILAVSTPTPAKDSALDNGRDVLRDYNRKTGVACIATEEPTVSRVWDMQTGKTLTELRGHLAPVMRAGMSQDGRWIALWDGSSVEIWNLISGQLQAKIESAGWTMSLEFSSDGMQLATTGGQNDPVARVWDVRTGKLLQTFAGHGNTIEHASFSPDGRLLVTASADNTVMVWSAATGEIVTTFDAHSDMVFSARFDPDSKRILTASADRTARMFDCTLCISANQLRALALEQAPRQLTPEQRTKYLH